MLDVDQGTRHSRRTGRRWRRCVRGRGRGRATSHPVPPPDREVRSPWCVAALVSSAFVLRGGGELHIRAAATRRDVRQPVPLGLVDREAPAELGRRPLRAVPAQAPATRRILVRLAPVRAGRHRDQAGLPALVVLVRLTPRRRPGRGAGVPGLRSAVRGSAVDRGSVQSGLHGHHVLLRPVGPHPEQGRLTGHLLLRGRVLGRGSPHGVSADLPTCAQRVALIGRPRDVRAVGGGDPAPRRPLPRSALARRDRHTDRTGPAFRVHP